MALKKVGVELVADGQPSFAAALDAGNQQVAGFAASAEGAGGKVSMFGEIATGALRQVGTIAVDALAAGAKAAAGFVWRLYRRGW